MLTDSQRRAVAKRGNVLVVAGAGTGKTRTLVERCLSLLLDPVRPVSLTEILVVTFTEAAAAEMRERIRHGLDQKTREELQKPKPDESLRRQLQEQQAIFEMAHVGTLHGFCLKLVREYFFLLGLDPQFTVMAEEEAAFLAQEELSNLLQEHYAGRTESASAVQELIASHAGGSDRVVRNLVLRIHNYSQTLPNPDGWLGSQLELWKEETPSRWNALFSEAVRSFISRWFEPLRSVAPANDLANECASTLETLDPSSCMANFSRLRTALETIVATRDNCPRGKMGLWRDPLNGFYSEAEFLLSLVPPGGARRSDENSIQPVASSDPLLQDWQWVRPQMEALLQLAEEFARRFSAAKRELALVDFHDLEQFALRILWNSETGDPAEIAREWQHRLQYVFVDEYQDINAAQDKILQLVSRAGTDANRFLVGDVKQSIYRFRLAAPHIFQNYAREWGAGNDAGCSIPLSDNFRSREGILDFVNSLFPDLMREDLGGVAYTEEARLRFGAPRERAALSAQAGTVPPVEVHLRIKRRGKKSKAYEETDEASAQIAELQEAEKEARLVGIRLGELRSAGHQIWDDATGAFRAADWKDMAILLRAPSGKAEAFAKEFSRLNIPLAVARGGFYRTTEITDLLSLLKILDNPLQDTPALAVLRSPLVGLTLDELATIRLAAKGHFWTALLQWHESAPGDRSASDSASARTHLKVTGFLSRFSEWRRLARQVPLSWCLEAILNATHYADWLLVQARGEQRHANLQRLISLARQFDHFQRQGLFRFLLFIEAQETSEVDPPVKASADENAVRLLSIHQSKGLEFPVVVLADMGKGFNVQDLKADVILDEIYGICPRIKPPHTGKRYPSLPSWLARRRQKNELLGEELRLLYVALTRARDMLVLSGTLTETKLNEWWTGLDLPFPDPVESANSFADWLGLWFSKHVCPRKPPQTRGSDNLISWAIHEDTTLAAPPVQEPNGDSKGVEREAPLEAWENLREKLSAKYPFVDSTRQPAKSSVSSLRRQAALVDDEFGASANNFGAGVAAPDRALDPGAGEVTNSPAGRTRAQRPAPSSTKPRRHEGRAMDVGSAMHAYLQLVSLESVGTRSQLEAEAARLMEQKILTREEAGLLNFGHLERFWGSQLGQNVQAHRDSVVRELPFTFKLPLPLFSQLMARSAGTPNRAQVDSTRPDSVIDDFIVVQGVADLVLLMPNEIQIIDFKTDRVTPEELSDRARLYEPQLKLYCLALSGIYRRPVSHCWLYFLTLAEPVEIASAQVTSHIQPESGSCFSPQ